MICWESSKLKNCRGYGQARHISKGAMIFDIGGGNGFVSKGLVESGYEPVLIEPGPDGDVNAQKRGLKNIVHSTVEDAQFKHESLQNVGMFDVIEHLENDADFLQNLQPLVCQGGIVAITVPAYNWLWSEADDFAGHYRRYTRRGLSKLLTKSGYEVLSVSGIFSFLIPPIAIFRATPYRLGIKEKSINQESAEKDHCSNSGLGQKMLSALCKREIASIKNGHSKAFGASLLAIAIKK
jgi:SAM-dependent methyltransferase